MEKLLDKSPRSRMTAQQSLNHDFFKAIREQKLNYVRGEPLNQEIFRQLTGYRGISQLKKAALNLIIKEKNTDDKL